MKRYEIHFLDNGKTVIWSARKASNFFGKDEWPEYRENYLPHVLVAELDDAEVTHNAEV